MSRNFWALPTFRFLDNIRLTPELLIPLHIALACGTKLREHLPMVLDQTSIRGIETVLIGLVFEGRVFLIAFSCFMKRFIQDAFWGRREKCNLSNLFGTGLEV